MIGFYHHKSDEPLSQEHVANQAERLGFKFPVAVDPEWQTLNKWWLDTGDRDFTSVSFPKDSKDYQVMKAKIEELLKEP